MPDPRQTPAPLAIATDLSYSRFAIFKPAGSITAATLEQFETAIRESLTAERHSLLLDLAGLTFISSAGLGALMVAHRLSADRGGEVVFAAVQPDVQRLFDLFDYGTIFRMFPTVGQAAEALLA